MALNHLLFWISQAVKPFVKFPSYTPQLPQPLSSIAVVSLAQGLDERRALLQRISCEALLPRLDAIPVDGRWKAKTVGGVRTLKSCKGLFGWIVPYFRVPQMVYCSTLVPDADDIVTPHCDATFSNAMTPHSLTPHSPGATFLDATFPSGAQSLLTPRSLSCRPFVLKPPLSFQVFPL